jgi:hypothetical protein
MQGLMCVIVLLSVCMSVVSGVRSQPNIIFILADDLGWNDVSWNNRDMPTPNLEQLASEGIRLDQAYSQQVGELTINCLIVRQTSNYLIMRQLTSNYLIV